MFDAIKNIEASTINVDVSENYKFGDIVFIASANAYGTSFKPRLFLVTNEFKRDQDLETLEITTNYRMKDNFPIMMDRKITFVTINSPAIFDIHSSEIVWCGALPQPFIDMIRYLRIKRMFGVGEYIDPEVEQSVISWKNTVKEGIITKKMSLVRTVDTLERKPFEAQWLKYPYHRGRQNERRRSYYEGVTSRNVMESIMDAINDEAKTSEIDKQVISSCSPGEFTMGDGKFITNSSEDTPDTRTYRDLDAPKSINSLGDLLKGITINQEDIDHKIETGTPEMSHEQKEVSDAKPKATLKRQYVPRYWEQLKDGGKVLKSNGSMSNTQKMQFLMESKAAKVLKVFAAEYHVNPQTIRNRQVKYIHDLQTAGINVPEDYLELLNFKTTYSIK